jgi:hypothetical protein
MHDEINDAHVYEMKNAICGSQTPGVLQLLIISSFYIYLGLEQFTPLIIYELYWTFD